ncbi:MAG: GNAT family N-acetyltransferase [Ferruginibacter sp.]|nr:GNAT family N-acetyltransferase [Cytophagales bacterium]
MTPINFSVRPVTPANLSTLIQLSRQTFTEAFGSQNKPENMDAYVSRAFSEAQLGEEVRDPRARFFLALAGPEPVGYAKLRQGKQPAELEGYHAVEIQRIYVLASAKGQGIGKRLMQSCLDTARSEGYGVVWLGVWEHNPRAIAFYRQWGFEVFSAYLFPFGDEDQTDLLMRKWI